MGKILKLRKRLKKDERGAMMLPIILLVLCGVIVFLFFMDFFDAAIKYQNVTYAAKQLSKIVECDGQVTSRPQDYLNNLNSAMGMDMTYTIGDVKYFNSSEKSIQFRDSFTITVKYTHEIKLFHPIGSKKPVTWKIPMRADITGMSEVYWK